MTNHLMLIACIAFTALLTTTRAQYQQQLEDAGTHQLLDIQTPQTFNINSPLKQPDSLRSRPYFDFLSTLYRHDTAKQQLFRPYQRTRRAAAAPAPVLDVVAASSAATSNGVSSPRARRAIVFRPLFVYKQQEIKKEQLRTKRRRRY